MPFSGEREVDSQSSVGRDAGVLEMLFFAEI